MAKVWDGIVEGSAGIAAAHFEDVFEQTGLEIFNSIGTSGALSANDGTWGTGLYSDAINQTYMDYGYKSVINYEQQMYHSNYWAHPSGWNPYSTVGNAIRITSSPIDQNDAAEKAWAVRKAYHLKPDGGLSTWDDFAGTPPVEWSPRGTYEGSAAVLFDDYPMLYKSGMLFGRDAYGFGEYTFVAKMPYGANGASADVNLRRATFPALWLLQMIFLGEGVNGQPSTDTATPFTNTGKLREPDVAELFGESARRIHHTAHYRAATGDPDYPFGVIDLQLKAEPQPLLPNDADSVFHEYKLQLTPGKLIFLIDGAVSFVVDTPADYAEPLRIYETVPGQDWNVVRDELGRGKWTGEYQRNPDNSLRYPRYRMLMNLAEGGKWPRDYAKQLHDGGATLPTHNETNHMDINYVSFRKLLDDNPDTYAGGDGNPDEEPSTPSAVSTHNPRLVIQMQPAFREGRPVQQIVAVPRDGYDPTGKTFTWSSSVPELAFQEQGTLTTTPSIQALSADLLATITIDDGE